MKTGCTVGKMLAMTGILLFLATTVVAADIKLSADQTCASASCHTNLTHSSGAHDGGPGQQFCAACHVADEPGEHEFRYAASGGQLCTGCHANLTQHEYKHAPANMGLCTFCHSAHETQYSGQLKFPPETLCVSCHNKIVPDGASTVHGPVEQGRCTACHDPHSSEIDDQLVAAVPQLCFGCHNQDQTDHEGKTLPAVEQTFVDKSLRQHPPFARGDCLLCHDPHASDNIRLQRRSYSQAFYTDFSSDKYFCLMCHGESTFTEPRTLTATKFRDGNLNLHYRHVDREKGRGCRACHHQHASSLEAQIATDTFLGTQNIGIRAFAKTGTGGTCESSCHRSVQYDRIDPVNNAFMMTPREGVDATRAELRQASKEQTGKTLFLQRCAGCHGADAQGKIGPTITGASVERVVAATGRVDLMSDLASLATEDLHAIVDSLPAGIPVVALPEGAPDGTVLFATNCAGCHGEDASGAIGPAIGGATSTVITQAIGRVPMMVAMKSLSAQSIDVIGDYLGGLADTTVASVSAATDAAPDGRVVYSMKCGGCHGADANGGIAPAIPGATSTAIAEANDRVPMMAGLKTLESAEIDAVSRYLVSLDTEETLSAVDEQLDGAALYSADCAGCHGEDASGHIGPDVRGQTAADVSAAIDRVPMMGGGKSSTEAQIKAVGEYIRGLAVSLPISADGAAIFKQNCAACHGADATGLVGPDITFASMEDIAGAVETVPMMIAMKILGADDIRATAYYLTDIRESKPAGVEE